MTSDLETVRAAGSKRSLPRCAAKPWTPSRTARTGNCSPLAELTGSCASMTYDSASWSRCCITSLDALPSTACVRSERSSAGDRRQRRQVRLFTVSQDKLALVHTAIANRATNTADQTPISGEYGVGVNSVAFAPSSATLAAAARMEGFGSSGVESEPEAAARRIRRGPVRQCHERRVFARRGGDRSRHRGRNGTTRRRLVQRLILRGEIEARRRRNSDRRDERDIRSWWAMLAAGGEGGTLQLIGVSGGKLALVGSPYQIGSTTRLNVPGVTAVTFASGETMLATATASATGAGAVQLFGVSRGRLTPRASSTPTHRMAVSRPCVRADGTALATAGVRLVVSRAHAPAAGTVDQTGEGTNSLAFEPDGAVLAAGDSDGRVRLFGLADGELKQRDSARADGSGDELGGGVAARGFRSPGDDARGRQR